MKTVTTTTYVCEVCGQVYSTEPEALACEQRPVTHDHGVKVGDIVNITSGDGAGRQAKVTSVGVVKPGWGPKAFDHSIVLVADIIGDYGSRVLHFDSYSVL